MARTATSQRATAQCFNYANNLYTTFPYSPSIGIERPGVGQKRGIQKWHLIQPLKISKVAANLAKKFSRHFPLERLFTQGGNDLYKKAVSASMNSASTCDLPSCDDLLKQFNDTKTQPLYDRSEKGAKPTADETPKAKSGDEHTQHHKSHDAHNADERVRDAHKIDRVMHPNSWDDIAKKANEVQHKIAEHARKDPDVVKVTESKKTGEKIETVTVEKKDGSKIVYGPTGETKHYPARHLPGNAALEDWLE